MFLFKHPLTEAGRSLLGSRLLCSAFSDTFLAYFARATSLNFVTNRLSGCAGEGGQIMSIRFDVTEQIVCENGTRGSAGPSALPTLSLRDKCGVYLDPLMADPLGLIPILVNPVANRVDER